MRGLQRHARTVLGWLLLLVVAARSQAASLTLKPDTVTGGAPTSATLVIDYAAPDGGLTVTLTSSSPAAKVPATVLVPAGQTTVTFPIPTAGVDSQVVATIMASANALEQKAALTINPVSLSSITLGAGSVVGGNPVTGTLALTGPAPSNGTKVVLASNLGTATVPGSVTVPAGQSQVEFSVTTKRLNAKLDVTITATLGYVASSASLAILPEGPASVSLNPPSVNGGAESTGTVTLTGPAPKGGLVISLTCANHAATIPATVKVEEGKSTATFPLKTEMVSTQVAGNVIARYEAQAPAATLTVLPPAVDSIVLNPETVVGSFPCGATLKLSCPAPRGGLPVALSSDRPEVILPPTLVIPAGKTTASFTFKTSGVAATTIAVVKATVGPVVKTAPLTISAPNLLSVELTTPTLDGGSPCNGILRISSPAPAAGLVIAVSSNQKAAQCPAKVTVPGGRTSVAFPIKTSKVAAQTTVTISAVLGSSTQTATLTLN